MGKRDSARRVNEPNITRFEYGRTKGWWVRIYRTKKGSKVCYSKHFSDTGSTKGKAGALKQAIRWRNNMIAELPIPQRAGGRRVPNGYAYVKQVDVKQRACWHPHWTAWLRVGHRKWLSTKFSIAVHGDQEAKRRCKLWVNGKRRELGLRKPSLRERARGV